MGEGGKGGEGGGGAEAEGLVEVRLLEIGACGVCLEGLSGGRTRGIFGLDDRIFRGRTGLTCGEVADETAVHGKAGEDEAVGDCGVHGCQGVALGLLDLRQKR